MQSDEFKKSWIITPSSNGNGNVRIENRSLAFGDSSHCFRGDQFNSLVDAVERAAKYLRQPDKSVRKFEAGEFLVRAASGLDRSSSRVCMTIGIFDRRDDPPTDLPFLLIENEQIDKFVEDSRHVQKIVKNPAD